MNQNKLTKVVIADRVMKKIKSENEGVYTHPITNLASNIKLMRDKVRVTIDLPRADLGIDDVRALNPMTEAFEDLKLIPVVTFIDPYEVDGGLTADLVDAAKWVTTSDKLPEQSEGCLLWAKHINRAFIGWASYWQPKNEFAGFTCTHPDDEEHSSSVTHWLQLPEAPSSSDEWNDVKATPPTELKKYLVWIECEDAFALAVVKGFNEDGTVAEWEMAHSDFDELASEITHWIELPEFP